MEANVKKTLQNVDRAQADLDRCLAAKDTTHAALEPQLAKLRSACQDLFFVDLQAAATHKVETRLWAGHQNVNNKFRGSLKSLRKDGKKPVERRKAEKLYLDFIKSSHKFYRGFIQRICSHFSGVGEIYDIARRMHLDLLSVDTPIDVDTAQKEQLLRSCHMTLIRCGDLSRYRELELGQKQRNWGPAKGYYECGAQLVPTSGLSFNQLSMMALADNDNFRALYLIYRCLTTADPFPMAEENLATLLRKVRQKSIEPSVPETKLGPAEVPFVKLHAKAYGDSFDDFRSERDSLMLRLSEVIETMSCNKSLKRLCLINIAAGYHCITNVRKAADADPEDFEKASRRYFMLAELNISTFTMLLLMASTELQTLGSGSSQRSRSLATILGMTPVLRRILPCLRLYSAWLLSFYDILVGHGEDSGEHQLPLESLWKAYAACMSSLTALVGFDAISDVPYLLDEDEDMLHFTPFNDAVHQVYLCTASGMSKQPRPQSSSDRSTEASRPDREMAYRLKGILAAAEHLQAQHGEQNTKPLPWLPSQTKPVLVAPVHGKAILQPEQLDPNIHRSPKNHANGTTHKGQSPSRQTISPLEDMVDNLVGPESASRTNTPGHRLTPSGHFDTMAGLENIKPSSGPQNNRPASRHDSPSLSFSTPGHRTSLSFYQTPFAPMPGELEDTTFNSRPSTAQGKPSPRLEQPDSVIAFEQSINRRKKDMAERSSPLSAFGIPSMPSTISDTPTGFDTFGRAQSRALFGSNAGLSPFASSHTEAENASPKKKVQAPRFGAIGDSRPGAAKTPTSGQPR